MAEVAEEVEVAEKAEVVGLAKMRMVEHSDWPRMVMLRFFFNSVRGALDVTDNIWER